MHLADAACKNMDSEQLVLLLSCPCVHFTIMDWISTPSWYQGGILYTVRGETKAVPTMVDLVTKIETAHGSNTWFRVPLLRSNDVDRMLYPSPVAELKQFLYIAWGFIDPVYEPTRLQPKVHRSGSRYPSPMLSFSLDTDDDDVLDYIRLRLPKGIEISPALHSGESFIRNHRDFSKSPLSIEEVRKINAYLKLKVGPSCILQPHVTVFDSSKHRLRKPTEGVTSSDKNIQRRDAFQMLTNQ